MTEEEKQFAKFSAEVIMRLDHQRDRIDRIDTRLDEIDKKMDAAALDRQAIRVDIVKIYFGAGLVYAVGSAMLAVMALFGIDKYLIK